MGKSLQLIKKAKKITILGHFRPDGDVISACAAMFYVLKKMGKMVETIYPNKPEFPLKRNPKNLLINKHKQIPDLLIALDTANYERCYFPKAFEHIPIINIDHHVSNSIKGTYNIIDIKASSTCEILFTILQKWGKQVIDRFVSECLLCGILSDSQVFQTQATTPKTLEISAKLMKYGANLYKIKNELTTNKDPNIVKLWGHLLSKIKITKSGKACWAKVTQKDLTKHNLELSSLIGFNNFLSQITGIDITLLFYQTKDGKTKVSLRSKKSNVDILASKFGGGGHKNAAGILSNISINTLEKKIIQLL
jgi:phosphoesterase RecJ-like protein